jgi:hypothetical protein
MLSTPRLSYNKHFFCFLSRKVLGLDLLRKKTLNIYIKHLLATRPFAETIQSENVQQDFIFDVENNIFKITIQLNLS